MRPNVPLDRARLPAAAAFLTALLAASLPGAPGAGAAETARFSRTLPLQPDTRIAVEATVGDIRVAGWQRPELSARIEWRAPTKADLDRMRVTIEETAGTLQIRAVHADDRKDPALTATVVIDAPAAAVFQTIRLFEGRLTLSNLEREVTAVVQRGPIDATNLSGAVRLETGIGHLTVNGAVLSDGGVLRLRTFNGDVRLRLARRPAHARILALTLNGRIMSDIPLRMQDRFGPHFGEATLGRGEPVISIDAVTGNVEIGVEKQGA